MTLCRDNDVEAGHAGDGVHRRRKEMVCPPCLAVLARLRREKRNAIPCKGMSRFGGPCGRMSKTGYCASHT